MASHRKIIRAKIVELLKGSEEIPATVSGQRVFAARILPIQSLEELPCLLAYTSDENSDTTGDSQFLVRTCTLSIEGAVIGKEDEVDDMLDDLTDQVEAVIDADPRLSGLLADDLVLKSTAMETGKEGENVIAGFRMDFDAVYHTARVEQDPFLDPPTKVYTDPHTNPDPYKKMLGVNQPPQPQSECACGPDGCNLPAWQGEIP